jgi:putative membrane fusion protein
LKKNKKKIKIKYTNIFVAGVFIYIIANIFSFFINRTIPTTIAENGRVEEKITKEAVIIRDEQVIFAEYSGTVKPNTDEGSRIQKGYKVATIYKKDVDEKVETEIEDLDKEIEDIKKGSNSILSSDVESLNSEIEKITYKVQSKALNKDIVNLSESKKEIMSLVNKKNSIQNNSVAVSNIENMESQKEILENKINKYTEFVLARNSGIVSFNADGFEDELTYENMDKLNVDVLNNIENKTNLIKEDKKVKLGDPILKVINNHKFYLAVVLDNNEFKNFKIGDSVKLANKDIKLDGRVYDKYKDKNSKNITIFEISQQNRKIYDTRVLEFDIIYKQLEGIKIPKDAIITKDSKTGVYRVSETGNVEFVELQGISGENDDFIVLSFLTIKSNGLKTVDLHDEILLKPNKVKEGQKIK